MSATCHVCPENDLYSATSINFLGSEPVWMRSSPVTIRTEFKSSWLNGNMLSCVYIYCVSCSKLRRLRLNFLTSLPSVSAPTFVSMTQIPESEMSTSGDDDKVYLFFSEAAVECDCYNKLVVSRVARVCKVRDLMVQTLIFVSCKLTATRTWKRLLPFYAHSVLILA